MHPRRRVEQFNKVTRTSGRGRDVRTYLASFRVNGERDNFKAAVPLSDFVRLRASNVLGRPATEDDMKAAIRVKIIDLVPLGLLDFWPPSEAIRVPGIDYTELAALFASAKRMGLIKA